MADVNSTDNFDDQLLSAYIDGELTGDERAAVEKRLQSDPQARQLVAELRTVSDSLRSLPKHQLGTDLREAILQPSTLSAERARTESRGPRQWVWAALAIAAALLLMVYMPENNHEGQPVAQAPLKAQAPLEDREAGPGEPKLRETFEKEASDLNQVAGLPSASSSGRSSGSELAVERAIEVDQIAAADSSGALGVMEDVLNNVGPIELPHTQPLGEPASEDYHVYLTHAGQGVGASRFDQLLAKHGIAMRGRSSISADQKNKELARDADDKRDKSTADRPVAGEAHLVLVEAPLEQVHRLIAACSEDDSLWKSVRLVDRDGINSGPSLFSERAGKVVAAAETGAGGGLVGGLKAERSAASQSEGEPLPSQLADVPISGWAVHLGRDQVSSDEMGSTAGVDLFKRNRARRLTEERVDLEEQPVATVRVLFILRSPAE